MNKEILNGSGCRDLTAYEAIKHVEREERRKQADEESRKNCRCNDGKGCEYCWNREISEESDNINHPSHYETGQFECIDVMIETQGVEAVKGFCKCNAFKYLYRANRKNGLEDMKKAIWYLNKYVELEERK